MKIYTKTGDQGTTSLFGGEKVDKDNLRLDAYGTVDELNSFIGDSLFNCGSEKAKDLLTEIQHHLFNLGAVLATPDDKKNLKKAISKIPDELINILEEEIDELDAKISPQKVFILPGGSKGACKLHIARTVCRRAERQVVTLSKSVEIDTNIVIYLNRLSDLLFVLARFENHINKTPDIPWNPK
ncbi:MAG: cob(I)yrinic acid a,c-diamide adenosyltransferase [Melioribacteraceae bacterium]|nr:cob(I)yrinic acid a,c-diamide adenosyltransferase [Melioribacteraceae bacterium]